MLSPHAAAGESMRCSERSRELEDPMQPNKEKQIFFFKRERAQWENMPSSEMTEQFSSSALPPETLSFQPSGFFNTKINSFPQNQAHGMTANH